MSIEELVKKYVAIHGFIDGLTSADAMRAALTEQAETHALELRAYEATVQNLEQRIKDLQLEMLANGESQRVPEGWKLVPTRCPLCEYQHGHKIGCENNPVDISMLAAAPKKDTSHD